MNTTYKGRKVEIESLYGNSAYTQYSAFVDGYSVSPIPRVTVQMAEKDAKQYIDAEESK